jgi:HEPN domain-containing protein
MPPDTELLRKWLHHVEADLRCAEYVLTAQPPFTLDACFHCQQAAEKTLKAFLVFRGVDFERSHVIGYLVDLCTEQDAAFEELRASAVGLTAYATRVRYPHFDPPPSADEARQQLEVAKCVRQFVLDRLPDDVLAGLDEQA